MQGVPATAGALPVPLVAHHEAYLSDERGLGLSQAQQAELNAQAAAAAAPALSPAPAPAPGQQSALPQLTIDARTKDDKTMHNQIKFHVRGANSSGSWRYNVYHL